MGIYWGYMYLRGIGIERMVLQNRGSGRVFGVVYAVIWGSFV